MAPEDVIVVWYGRRNRQDCNARNEQKSKKSNKERSSSTIIFILSFATGPCGLLKDVAANELYI